MNDRQLSLYLSVVERGSFNKAEMAEHLSRQAIIAQINALESEVGVPLLERTSHGVKPTKAGLEFYHGARKLLSSYDELLAKVQGRQEIPRLRIAAIEHHVLLRPIVAAFHARYPAVAIVDIYSSKTDELSLVRENRIDVGETPFLPGQEQKGVNYRKIYDAPYLCLMRPDHPLAHCERISIPMLAGHRVVLSENRSGCLYSAGLRSELDAVTQVECHSNIQMRKVSLVYDACASGAVYISASPFLLQFTDCAMIPLDAPYTLEYGVVFAEDPPEPVRNFVDLARFYYQKDAGP